MIQSIKVQAVPLWINHLSFYNGTAANLLTWVSKKNKTTANSYLEMKNNLKTHQESAKSVQKMKQHLYK